MLKLNHVCFSHILQLLYECHDCAKADAQHTYVKAVHSIKKLVVDPMPLCYSAKAALSYIAAGSRSSCGLLFIRLF